MEAGRGVMSRSVVTALLIGCLVFGLLLGLIGTNGSGPSGRPASSNLRDASHANHIKEVASQASEALPSARTLTADMKKLDATMLPTAFSKAADGLGTGNTVGAWGPDGEEKGDWNQLFGAGARFKAFDELMAEDDDGSMSFSFSYDYYMAEDEEWFS